MNMLAEQSLDLECTYIHVECCCRSSVFDRGNASDLNLASVETVIGPACAGNQMAKTTLTFCKRARELLEAL